MEKVDIRDFEDEGKPLTSNLKSTSMCECILTFPLPSPSDSSVPHPIKNMTGEERPSLQFEIAKARCFDLASLSTLACPWRLETASSSIVRSKHFDQISIM